MLGPASDAGRRGGYGRKDWVVGGSNQPNGIISHLLHPQSNPFRA